MRLVVMTVAFLLSLGIVRFAVWGFLQIESESLMYTAVTFYSALWIVMGALFFRFDKKKVKPSKEITE